MKKLQIAINFDNCITKYSCFPKIGDLRPEAKEIINKLYENHTIIINSCRTGIDQTIAIDFLNYNGIKFHYFNKNSTKSIAQYNNDARKINADLYIDDKNLGSLDWGSVLNVVETLQKPTLICLIGESGTGKSFIADYIKDKFSIQSVQSRTTRPPRYEGELSHKFVTSEDFKRYDKEAMIAYTKFGEYEYCALTSDVSDPSVYVIDEDGYLMLQSKHNDDFNLFGIRVKASEEVIKLRGIDQERIDRDEDKFYLEDKFFQFIVNTDSSDEDVHSQIDDIVDNIFININYNSNSNE